MERVNDRDAELLDGFPEALAARSPHAPPPGLRAQVLAAAAARPHSRRPLLWPLAAAAAALALVALAAWNVQLQQALAQDRSLLAQLRDAAAGQEIVFEIVDAPNTTKLLLRAPAAGPAAPYAKVYWRPDQRQVVAMAGRLPALAAGQTYELWLDQSRIGVIAPDESGFGYLVFDTGARGPSYSSGRVLLQPSGSVVVAGAR